LLYTKKKYLRVDKVVRRGGGGRREEADAEDRKNANIQTGSQEQRLDKKTMGQGKGGRLPLIRARREELLRKTLER